MTTWNQLWNTSAIPYRSAPIKKPAPSCSGSVFLTIARFQISGIPARKACRTHPVHTEKRSFAFLQINTFISPAFAPAFRKNHGFRYFELIRRRFSASLLRYVSVLICTIRTHKNIPRKTGGLCVHALFLRDENAARSDHDSIKVTRGSNECEKSYGEQNG